MRRTNQGLAHVTAAPGTPDLEQVLLAGEDAGGNDISNLSSIAVTNANVTGTILAAAAGIQTLAIVAGGTGIAAGSQKITGVANGVAADDAATVAQLGTAPGLIEDIEFLILEAAAITAGVKGDLQIDFPCTIISWTLLADQSGSIIVNIWKDTYANYPPVVGDKITASAPPTLSGVIKNTDTTLTGWTKTITAGDTLRFNVDALATSVTRVTLSLKVQRT